AAPAAPAVPVDSRATLASWLCSKDNPRFAAVIANRMWQKVFGRGLVEPIDDWKDDTKASNPELLQYLARLMVDLKFDLRQFQRVLLSTRTFQRAVPDDDCRPDQPYLFPGPVLSRMRAEQLWDSLLTLVFDDLDQRLRPTDARSKEVYDRYDQYAKATPEQLHELLGQAAMRTADPQQFQQQQRSKLQQGRLAEQAEKQRQARPLYRELQQAQKNGDLPRIAALTAQLRELGVPLPGERAGRGREGDLLRASDLPQPAPAGHLLRQFGQSDRETVDGGNAAASVPQVLTLLNGFLDQRVLNGGSALRATVAAAADPAHKVAAVYLAVLSRPPAPAEQTEWSALLHGSGDAALRDLVWVLCNSHEFRFVR
ncbi:MAG TPA: DUF1553 domain-containing protein, partial [Planctomycetota bacterium]|nr:DUF1553 domain-containing protein [Planctomycetota bacterium]